MCIFIQVMSGTPSLIYSHIIHSKAVFNQIKSYFFDSIGQSAISLKKIMRNSFTELFLFLLHVRRERVIKTHLTYNKNQPQRYSRRRPSNFPIKFKAACIFLRGVYLNFNDFSTDYAILLEIVSTLIKHKICDPHVSGT